jgi:hypothetical protein
MCLNDIKGSKKGESRYKTMNGKPSFQNRRIDGSHSKVFRRRSNFECLDARKNDRDQ